MQIGIKVSIRPDYTCSICGTKREGTDTYTSALLYDLFEAQEYIDGITRRPPAQGIPVGWSSNGYDLTRARQDFRCGCVS